MKKMFVFVIAVMVLVAGAPVFAWESAYVEGTAVIEGLKTHGDDLVGGWSYGKASGSFQVWGWDGYDGSVAEGEAGADGTLRGKSFTDGNVAKSKFFFHVSSSATQLQGVYGQISISGLAQQANWAELNKGEGNFIAGGNFTEAGYEGFFPGPSPIASGEATASGKTVVELTSTSAYGKTVGRAEASLTGTSGNVDPWVSGEGYLNAGNYVQRPGTTAGAEIGGYTTFSASDPQHAAGNLKITGGTQVIPTPSGNEVTMSATINAVSRAKSGGPAGK